MTTLFKGILLNDPGEPAPWSAQEFSNFQDIINSISIDTNSGTLADAKTIGHHHFRMYSQSANVLTLSIDSSQKVTLTNDLKVGGAVQIDSMSSAGILMNDSSGNITGGHPAGSTLPGGVEGSVQFKTGTAFDGDNRMVYSGEDLALRNPALTNTITLDSDPGSITVDDGTDTAIITRDSMQFTSSDTNPNARIFASDNLNMVFNGYNDAHACGWFTPPVMEINAGDPTKYDITTGGVAYFPQKGTTPFNMIAFRLATSVANVIAFGTGPEIHVFMNAGGAIVTFNDYDSLLLFDHVYLGNFTKTFDQLNLGSVINLNPTFESNPETFRMLLNVIGGIQIVSMSSVGVTGTLSIQRTSGTVIRQGSNAGLDRLRPDHFDVEAKVLVNITHLYSDENGDVQVDIVSPSDNFLNPTKYYDKDTMAFVAVASSKFTIQRYYVFASAVPADITEVIMFGNEIFNNLVDAENAFTTPAENFVKPAQLINAVLLGAWIVKGNATDTTILAQATFMQYTQPFEIIGGGSSGFSSIDLQSSYNASVIPQILTSLALGAFTIKQGSGADTDDVFAVQNAADAQTFSIKGNGNVLATDLITIDGSSNSELALSTTNAGNDAIISFDNDDIKFAWLLDGTNDSFRLRNLTTATDMMFFNGTSSMETRSEFFIMKSNATATPMTFILQGEDSSNGGILMGSDGVGGGTLQFNTGSDRRVLIDDTTGNVIIGTASENWTLLPIPVRVGNGIPGGRPFINVKDFQLELNTDEDILRIGPITNYASNSVKIASIANSGNPMASFNMEATAIIINNGANSGRDLFDETPSGPRDFSYIYSSTVGGTPATETIRFNNASPALATKMFVDFKPYDKPTSVESYLESVTDGVKAYLIQSERQIEKWMEFTIDSVIPQTGYTEFDISNVTFTGTVWANTGNIELHITDATSGGGGGSSVTDPFFAVPTSNQSMANGVTIVPNMDSEDYDSNSVFNLSTDTFTAATEGVHMITAGTKVSVAASGQIESYLYINGTLRVTASGSINTAGTMVANVSVSRHLEVGDTVQLRAAQFSGFAGTMLTSETFISGHCLPFDIA